MIKWMDKLLEKLSANPAERRNIAWMGFSTLIKSADIPLFTGAQIQAFQVKLGMNNQQIGNLAGLGQAAIAFASVAFMGIADRIKNRILTVALLTGMMSVYPAVMVLLCLAPESLRQPGFAYPLMATFQVAENLIIGFNSLVAAALFVRALRIEIAGRYTGLLGLIGGIFGMGVGVASGFILREFGYPLGFLLDFGVAFVLAVMAGLAMLKVRELPELACPSSGTGSSGVLSSFGKIVRMREFRLLLGPNILRGLGEGASGFIMVVGMNELGLPVEYAGWTTALMYLATMIGTTTMAFTTDRFGSGRVLLAADAVIALSYMGLVLTASPLWFMVFFGVRATASMVEQYAVPMAHYVVVPREVIGAFSGVRLMILAATNAVAFPVCGYMMDRMHPVYVFGGCAVLKVITGVLYWYAFHTASKQGKHA